MGICLGYNKGNFQLHRFTTSENIAKSFKGGRATFLTRSVDRVVVISALVMHNRSV